MTHLQPSATYHHREYTYSLIGGNQLAEGVLVIHVLRGRKELGTRYALQCDRNEHDRLQTVYLAKMHSEDGDVYGVEFTADGRSRCSCPGYRRHGSCKHNDAVRDLLDEGMIEWGDHFRA